MVIIPGDHNFVRNIVTADAKMASCDETGL